MHKVLILLCAPEDENLTVAGQTLLRDFRISYQLRVGSAQINADYVREMIAGFQKEGGQAILCVASPGDPLASLAAACSSLPVLSVSAAAASSDVGPVPVASLGHGAVGCTQAVLFILQMLALKDGDLAKNVQRYRHSLSARHIAADQKHRVIFDV